MKPLKNRRSSCKVILNERKLYAFTLHANRIRWPSPQDYEEFMFELSKHCFEVQDYVFEVGKLTKNCQSGKLHVQGTLTAPFPLPYIRHLIGGSAINLSIKPLFKEEGWAAYNAKQQAEEVRIYLISHFWDFDSQDYDYDDPMRSS